MIYDEALHAQVSACHSRSLELIAKGMETYLHGKESKGAHRRNGEIVAADVRLATGRELETLPLSAARARAAEAGLDLVAVTADPSPICRLLPPVEEEERVGKKFHDPLAACCAIDESIGTWAEVELYREGGQWGSRLAPGSGVHIITAYDRARFIATLTDRVS